MSVQEGSNNNSSWGWALPSDAAVNNSPIPAYSHDPKYYYEDGNVVFLVDQVRFKLHKSILASHMYKDCEFGQIKRTDAGLATNEEGSGDANPIVVRNTSAQDFRNFLLAILGTPGDPEFLSLLSEAEDDRNHTKDTFLRHLGISVLAERFGMTHLEAWSCSRLELVLKSVARFANSKWDKDTLLRVMRYADALENNFGDEMCALVRLALSTSAPKTPLKYQRPLISNLDTCVALYKDPELSKKHPALSGYAFTVILSLGHNSSVWADQLTREDRYILYAAQAHLISISRDPDLQLSQVLQPPEIFPTNFFDIFAASCRNVIFTAWGASFASLGDLDSSAPLEDVSKLVLLPACREIFANSLRTKHPTCVSGDCGRKLHTVDTELNKLFVRMHRKYRHFVRRA